MPELKLKKPKAIIFDFSGTAAKSYFTEKILMSYLREHLMEHLEENWEKPEMEEELKPLREAVKKDREEDDKIPEILPKGAEKKAAMKAVHDCVMYYLDNERDNPAMSAFKFSIWFAALKADKIRTPIYSDVVIQLKRWKMEQRVKVYIFSHGWAQAQKMFLAHTNHGDLSQLVDGHFDTEIGELTDKESYLKILTEIREEAKDCIFLTKCPAEARASLNAGIKPILVIAHERVMAKIDKKDREDFARIKAFTDLILE